MSMSMHFRSFDAYESPDAWKRAKYDENGKRIYTLDDLGKQIIYSRTIHFNPYCKLGVERYDERLLSRELGWKSIFMECVKFARDHEVIGFVTFVDDESKQACILTEHAYLNAYEKIASPNSFYIFFNARPERIGNKKNVLTVGYDQYALVRDLNSVIVWNLDRFAFLSSENMTFWGIRHDTDRENSVTGDIMVGVCGEKVVHVV